MGKGISRFFFSVFPFLLVFFVDFSAGAADSGWLPGEIRASLVGGEEIYRHTLQALEGARHAIDVEVYSFGDDDLALLLSRKAKAGVAVRVILDRDSDVNRATKRFLSARGVSVVLFPTVRDAIDHVKLVIVDGQRAIVGGANWGEHSPKNFDAAVEVSGRPVEWLKALYEQDWQKSKGRLTQDPVRAGSPLLKKDQTCRVVTDGDIRAELVHQLYSAKRSISMALYVLTDREVMSEVINAHERGIKVRVVLDPGDDPPLNLPAYQRLMKNHVPVRWYQPDHARFEKCHIKMVIIDERMVMLGSANLTFRGLKTNHECVIFLANLDSVQRFHRAFDRVWIRGRY